MINYTPGQRKTKDQWILSVHQSHYFTKCSSMSEEIMIYILAAKIAAMQPIWALTPQHMTTLHVWPDTEWAGLLPGYTERLQILTLRSWSTRGMKLKSYLWQYKQQTMHTRTDRVSRVWQREHTQVTLKWLLRSRSQVRRARNMIRRESGVLVLH